MTRPPLPERVRPATLSEVLGQDRWFGPDAALRRAIDAGRLPSLVLWGPPGCGKTTLARLLASHVGARLVQLSAVLDGVKDLRQVVDSVASGLDPRPLVLLVDEIHRWNRAQQDALLPHVESGAITLIGCTTENPTLELRPALRSRLQVIELDPLTADEVVTLLRRAIAHPDGLGRPDLTLPDDAMHKIAAVSGGDGRRALGDLERAAASLPEGATLTLDALRAAVSRSDLRHDRSGTDHHDCLSALIKSMRGSDPDAAIYWLARLLAGGEDPRGLARRLVIFAAEDVGNADHRALLVATAAADAARHVGMPEVRIPLAQAVTWLACAPKSNAAYLAINEALDEVKRTGPLPVPRNLRNSPGAASYGPEDAYLYPHDHPHRIVRQRHVPDALASRRFYEPTNYGDEKLIRERLAWWRRKLSET